MSFIWSTTSVALDFLIFTQVLAAAKFCKECGSAWRWRCGPNKASQSCTYPCTASAGWKSALGSFMNRFEIPSRMGPVKFLRFLWWFSQRCKREQLRYYTGLGAKSAGKACHAVRLCLLCIVTNLLMTEKLVGLGKVVMIDETSVSTKKRKKGVQGPRTAGNQQ